MAFDDIEKKLYMNDEKVDPEEELEAEKKKKLAKDAATQEKAAIPSGWETKKSIGGSDFKDVAGIADRYPVKKIIFWGVIWIALGAVLTAGYFLYQAFTYSGVNLQISLDEPVLAGVPFDVTINYSNNSPSVLSNTRLSVTLPSEFTFVGADNANKMQTIDIGTVGPANVGQQVLKLTAMKGEGTCADIIVNIEYTTVGVISSFEKSITKSVCIGGSAAVLNVFSPNRVYSNETFDLKVDYKNISGESLKNLELRVEYPQNYTFQNASIKPDLGDNIWRLGDLRAGSTNLINIQGSVIAQADSFFDIKVKLVSKSLSGEYVVTEKSVSISVSTPPLSIVIVSDTSPENVVKPGGYINYTLQYKNNTDIGFQDVVIRAQLTGEMYNFGTIEQDIDFNSVTHELTWNKSRMDSLGLLAPGASGSINFKVDVLDKFPIVLLSDKNYSLKANVQIDSPTVPSYVSAERTISIASMTTKVAGIIKIESKGLFRDASSGILNSGQVPPQVNKATKYTVHWIITNYATDVSGVVVRASLEPGVRGTGVVKSNIETTPFYNDRTQEITWNIPKISATRGVLGEPIEGIFQIEALPAVNQAETNMALIGETTITALDLFTNVQLNNNSPGFDTTLNGKDPTLKFIDGRVRP